MCEIDRFRQDVFDLWIDRGLKPISGLEIGVGPPRGPESRDTLGRILGIFASVSPQIFYSSVSEFLHYYRFTDSLGDTARHSSVDPVYFTMTLLSSKTC